MGGSRGHIQEVAIGPSRSSGYGAFMCAKARNSSPTLKLNTPPLSRSIPETVLPVTLVLAICFRNESMVNDSRSSKTALMIGPPGPQLALGESACFFLKKPNISRPSSHCTGLRRRALAHLPAVPDANVAPDHRNHNTRLSLDDVAFGSWPCKNV